MAAIVSYTSQSWHPSSSFRGAMKIFFERKDKEEEGERRSTYSLNSAKASILHWGYKRQGSNVRAK
jgi:hypothetical protein